jgi:GT2 family glycosyltransferase
MHGEGTVMPRLGVVTVTYNSADVLPDFLASLRRQDVPAGFCKVYAIDNASTDKTVEMLGRRDIPISVVSNNDNLGFSAGSNQGIRRALEDGCDYVLLLNNDTVFDAGHLRALVEVADRTGARVLTPRIDNVDPADGVWYAGGGVRPWRAFSAVLLRPGESAAGAEYSAPVTVAFASGCCLLIHHSIFFEVGMLDEDYFVYCEDMDYCLRLTQRRIPIVYAGEIRMVHKASSLTGGPTSAFSLTERTRNQVFLIRKHAGRLQRVVGLLYLQTWIVTRCITRRDDVTAFRRRERAFFTALRAELATPSIPHGEAGHGNAASGGA